MYTTWYDVIPEISLIKNAELRDQVVAVHDRALRMSGWTLDDMDKIPFTLLIPDTIISYRTHVRSIVKMLDAIYPIIEEMYGDKLPVDYDQLIAGALLHDVGKIIEYAKDADGKMVKSDIGKSLRHPFTGAGLAMECGLPHAISHIVAVHAGEGNGRYRTPEAVMVNKIDMLNFDALRAVLGLV